jgi:hypothetical protein
MDAGPTRYNRFVERRPCRAPEDYDAAPAISREMSRGVVATREPWTVNVGGACWWRAVAHAPSLSCSS